MKAARHAAAHARASELTNCIQLQVRQRQGGSDETKGSGCAKGPPACAPPSGYIPATAQEALLLAYLGPGLPRDWTELKPDQPAVHAHYQANRPDLTDLTTTVALEKWASAIDSVDAALANQAGPYIPPLGAVPTLPLPTSLPSRQLPTPLHDVPHPPGALHGQLSQLLTFQCGRCPQSALPHFPCSTAVFAGPLAPGPFGCFRRHPAVRHPGRCRGGARVEALAFPATHALSQAR